MNKHELFDLIFAAVSSKASKNTFSEIASLINIAYFSDLDLDLRILIYNEIKSSIMVAFYDLTIILEGEIREY
jgi:hypothetical protein